MKASELFNTFYELEKSGVDIYDVDNIKKHLSDCDLKDGVIMAHLNLYKVGIDFRNANDDDIALVLVNHWIDNLYSVPEEMQDPNHFVGWCAIGLQEGGIDYMNDEDWDRFVLIVNKALKLLYNDDMDFDKALELSASLRRDILLKGWLKVDKEVNSIVNNVEKIGFLRDKLNELGSRLTKLMIYSVYFGPNDYKKINMIVDDLSDKVSSVSKIMQGDKQYQDYLILKKAGLYKQEDKDSINNYLVKRGLSIKGYLDTAISKVDELIRRFSNFENNEITELSVNSSGGEISISLRGKLANKLKKRLLKSLEGFKEENGVLKRLANFEDKDAIIEKIEDVLKDYDYIGDDYVGYKIYNKMIDDVKKKAKQVKNDDAFISKLKIGDLINYDGLVGMVKEIKVGKFVVDFGFYDKEIDKGEVDKCSIYKKS